MVPNNGDSSALMVTSFPALYHLTTGLQLSTLMMAGVNDYKKFEVGGDCSEQLLLVPGQMVEETPHIHH
jgi:hypothetical protein